MIKKKVVLSFDYELFFGDKSGTVSKSLIEPTNSILNAMDSVGFKGNFFVDWQMLKYLSKEDDNRTQKDLSLIVNQLKDIVKRGHRIELHIHPHWVDAKYKGDGIWDFSDFRHYSLDSFCEGEIVKMIEEGTSLLSSIAKEVDPCYQLCAFRAGGWAVQPFDKIKSGLRSAGIFIDSSVMPGVHIKTDYSECDFTSAPAPLQGWYRFNDNVCIEDKYGDFCEIPITRAKNGILRRIIAKLSRNLVKYDFTSLTDGTHTRINDKPDVWQSTTNGTICTLSKRAPYVIPLLILEDKKELFCFIDHPKDFTKYTCSNLKLLSRFSSSVLYVDLKEQII